MSSRKKGKKTANAAPRTATDNRAGATNVVEERFGVGSMIARMYGVLLEAVGKKVSFEQIAAVVQPRSFNNLKTGKLAALRAVVNKAGEFRIDRVDEDHLSLVPAEADPTPKTKKASAKKTPAKKTPAKKTPAKKAKPKTGAKVAATKRRRSAAKKAEPAVVVE